MNCGIEGSGCYSLVFCDQVIGILMKIADASNHGSGGNKMIATDQELLQKLNVFRISFDEAKGLIVAVALINRTILGEIVQTNNFITVRQQFINQVTANE